MSTTAKYNFVFLIPISIVDIPIPFEQFKIPETEAYYSYNQYMELPGNKAFYTDSGSHALLSMNVTSIFDFAKKFPKYLSQVAPYIVIKEGVDIAAWTDTSQENYIWILSTEPKINYNYNKFSLAKSQSKKED